MKRIFLGVAAIASLLSASAMAADLAPKMYTKAPPPVVLYDWNGFYVGGNVGYSWGSAKTDGSDTGTVSVSQFRTAGPTLVAGFPVVTPFATLPLWGRSNVNGVIGGGQLGYNWQRGSWLFGLETDIQGSGERGSSDVCTIAGCPAGSTLLTANYKLDWFGTARGRVGFLPTDRVLLYATGGLAYGHLSADSPLIPLTWGSVRAGWTVGAGAEVALDPNWSFKVEYLYMDLGNIGGTSASATTITNALNTPSAGFNTVTTTSTTATFNTHFTDNIVRVGVNYRFGGPVVAKY
jgi:outer membrane immunogenic protein